MALIKCPECGQDASSQAEKCPHCGYPLRPIQYSTPVNPIYSFFLLPARWINSVLRKARSVSTTSQCNW